MSDQTHYLPDDRDAGHWGLRLSGGGQGRIAVGAPYPGAGHPDSHRFRWDRGRILREFQLVVITAGRGSYEDRSGSREIRSGLGFLLVPGRWHRYRPDPATGWEERWLAFDGPAVRRRHEAGGLDPNSPAWRSPVAPALRSRLDEILALLRHRPAAWRAEGEALTASILARITASDAADDDPLHRAAQRLAGDLRVTITDLAAEAGLSPSRFRERFQLLHGTSPRRYRQAAIAAQAQRLLAVPGTTMAEVAATLGFAGHAQFTRGFRRAAGESPSAWRARTSD